MYKYLLVFRSARKEKGTIGVIAIMGDYGTRWYNSGYDYHHIGEYSVQTKSIYHNIQVFLKNPLYKGIL